MRDIVISILIATGLVTALFSATGSLLVLNWIWFQRPYDFSWGLWNTTPMFLIAVALASFSNLVRQQIRPRFPPIVMIFFALLVWITLSAAFATNTKHAWEFYWAFTLSMWVMPLLLFATIHELNVLKWILWVAAGGIGFNGFKSGVVLSLSGGGHLTDQISGFVGDNNVFGLVLCLVVAILMGLRHTLPKRPFVRPAFYVFITFIIMCILYTKSRGALLSLGLIFVLASVLGGRGLRGLATLGIIACLAYWLVPGEYFERFNTFRDMDADVSAMGRLENWGLSWREAVSHPLFGVGPDNHLLYNKALQTGVQVRVAHSVYFQALGELGFPGLFLYLLFLGYGLMTLYSTWRELIPIAREHPDLAWARDLSFWMACGYTAYAAGSGLLNMLYIEFPWCALLYGAMLRPLVRAELAKRKSGVQERDAGAGASDSRQRRMPKALPAVPAWRPGVRRE